MRPRAAPAGAALGLITLWSSVSTEKNLATEWSPATGDKPAVKITWRRAGVRLARDRQRTTYIRGDKHLFAIANMETRR